MDEPGHLVDARASGLRAWAGRLGRSGVPEAMTGFLFMVYNEAFPRSADSRTTAALVLDLAICFFGGMTGRWPRVGTIGVGCCLLAVAVFQEPLSITALTLAIPIVSNGAHGLTVLRDVGSLAYVSLALLITLPDSPQPSDQVQTVVLWLVIVGLAWLTGRTINGLRREGERQAELRTESLRSQRRSIARDLHDTVAYAMSTMIMRAEQIKLRTGDDPRLVEDLDFIIATGRRSVRDLRGMMETLRRNDPEFEHEEDPAAWRIVTVADVLHERQTELAAHGLRLDVRAEDDLDNLPSSVRETLAKLVVEATSNMVKHASRGACQIIIEVHDDAVEAVFTNPLRREVAASGHEGLGLVGASERVQALGGELEATSASGTWILRAQLPLGE